nr:MAG TPA: hypothetical protein [Caudoviricetes sp.]
MGRRANDGEIYKNALTVLYLLTIPQQMGEVYNGPKER